MTTTVSSTRRQRLAAVAKAHDAWVDQNLAAVADEFDPAAHPKDDSDYNQHNLDVDATGEMEDELARMLEGVFDDPLTAAKDPDWDPDEHPRGPDGKFIESVGAADQAIKELKSAQAIASLAKSVAHLKGESYKALEIQAELLNIQKKIDTYEKGKKALLKKGKTSPSPQLPSAPVKPVSEGKPITAWTKKIYSEKYEDGQIVAVKDDGSARLVWDEESKKYQWQTKSAHAASSGWITAGQLSKKDAYAKFKDEKKSWLTPAAGATVTSEAPPSSDFDKPATTAPSGIAAGDFSSLKKVGPQGGSNPGGVYEDADGGHWYVKSQKSELHAKNEALAAAFYRMAGINVPEVVQGKGTPGLPGSAHTASKIVPGAKQPFPAALSDKSAIAEMRQGFALDAWLANWDVAGLTYDNVVKGSDGKLHRIDVGGALLFRAQGGEKGAAFGDEVKEFDSLRDGTNYVSQSIFGEMTAQEIAASAKKVAEISPDQIKNLVTQYGMDSSLADRLIARRADLLAKAMVKASTKITSPDFTILPKNKRGKSGDGYFAPKIWGKYGAAGVMMRNVDENGVARFLMVKANTQNSKKWQLPGGALEELESPEQGAAREVHEELGFTQDFLHGMTPIGTHKVAVDVPGTGTWHYSNIAVDVPSMPKLTWDEGELGGAKWFTADEIEKMRDNGEIHSALSSNLPQVFAKFDTAPKATAATPEEQADPTPSAPKISPTSSAKKTTWTKAKFTQALAYKTSYDQREVVGMADIGDFDSVQILWESGKFRYYKYNYDKKAWLYAGTWNTKKDVLASLKGKAFYQPPKGTMADFNQDYFNKGDLNAGFGTLTAQQQPDVLQELLDAIPLSAPSSQRAGLKIEPWVPAFADYKSSFILFNEDRMKVGAVHEGPDGEWIAAAKNIFKPYMSAKAFFDTKEEAVEALANADVAYSAAQAKPAVSVSVPPTASSKKLSKLTAAQIEKQNGTIPKTLKHTQKATFLKNLKENSTAGFVHSGEPDPKKVFTALVEAVKRHNATQSPKLNYLQGINVLDQVYGSKQKENVVAWLQTSEGKATAPFIVSAATGEKVVAIPNALSGVPSPYSIGTPKKVAPNAFRSMSLTDMLEMHEKMYKKNPMTYKQRSTIAEYKGSSNKFNEPLRGNPLLPLDKYKLAEIQTLQGAMRPTTQSFVTYRGTDGLGAAINLDTIKSLSDLKKFEGSVVGDPAFLSTAFEQTAAFSDKHFKLFINVPEGTPGTFAYAASEEYRYEKEFTLAAGLHYRIDRAEEMVAGYNNGYYNIYMTVVPEVKKK